MSRPRDIVQDFTVVEVTHGLYEGMRGWARGFLWLEESGADHKHRFAYVRLELVAELSSSHETIMVEVPLNAVRPADPQTIGRQSYDVG